MEAKLGKSVLLLFLFCWIGSGCNPNKDAKNSKRYLEEAISAPNTNVSPRKKGWFEEEEGDSTRQKHLEDNIILYESLLVNGARIYNKFYPQILDAFLFEDKFYLKARFPLEYPGQIQFTFPEYPDYVVTNTGKQAYQVVINDALDLNRVLFQLQYIPSTEDSLVSTHYSFTHVVFAE
ncbi:hypothetical protein SAMN04488057_101293 [Cyclobacterium lianum]|uniref:Lipoprotein n=1 Tax=Cyclobacterium lianum TaxID=388280 RepID=A0A1M7IDV1_9BACT|nr:hypothetical protein [Cyclobacterium lianum]SHM38941.1 hypothetical protein SAMN04488057_101293 [Cyclobacterium lianum]